MILTRNHVLPGCEALDHRANGKDMHPKINLKRTLTLSKLYIGTIHNILERNRQKRHEGVTDH